MFYDFGTGCGGDIFKLAGEFIHSSDFKAQAKYIADSMNVQLPMKEHPSFVSQPTEPVFQNVEISRLESPTLLRYLAQRGIPKEIAQKYCVKVDYQLRGKDYYAIGFENNAHGYELRSAFFKDLSLRSISPISLTAMVDAISLKASLTFFLLKNSVTMTATTR